VSTTPARSRRRLGVGLVLLAREEDMWAWGAFGAAAGGVITVAQSRRRENRD
jgi:hypothetical protein